MSNIRRYTITPKLIRVAVSPNELSSKFPFSPIKTTNITIHQHLKYFLTFLQFFGLFPVGGIRNSSHEKLCFEWISWHVVYSFFVVLYILGSKFLLDFVYTSWVFFTDNDFSNWFFMTLIIILNVICLLKLAPKWPNLIAKWIAVDNRFSEKYGPPKHLQLRINLLVAFYLISTIVNNVSYVIFNIKLEDDNATKIEMPEYYNQTFTNETKENLNIPVLIVTSIPVCICMIMPYMIYMFVNVTNTALTLRFKQICDRLEIGRHTSCIKFWIDIKRDYTDLANISRKINNELSTMVLISISSEFYFILSKVYELIRLQTQQGNFLYSAVFMYGGLSKLQVLFFYTYWLNDESRRPIQILYAVPSSVYNVEIRRWFLQMQLDSVAFTGGQFFKVTRGLILGLAGAMVSYELIYIQFKES